MQRHFPYDQPRFGTKHRPEPESEWKNSVYYWWWEYLRRNDDYKQTCLNGGKGKCAKLYEDFGDVHTEDFKTWWSVRGRSVHLFAEPPTPTIQLIRDASEIGLPRTNAIILHVPLNLPMTHLYSEFKKVLKKHHSGKRGKRANLSSGARYKVNGKYDQNFLQDALLVWDYKQAHPEKKFWEVAQDTKIVPKSEWVDDGDSNNLKLSKKNYTTAVASRLYRKATNIITNVAKGKFPVSKTLG